jgi:hypothetical protein
LPLIARWQLGESRTSDFADVRTFCRVLE